MSKLSLIAAIVICSMPSGYRRANIAFNQGENAVDVTSEQYNKIAQDKNLLITKTETATGEHSQGALDDVLLDNNVIDPNESLKNGGLGDDILDVSTAPKPLQDFIIAIDELNAVEALTKKPTCDQLAISVEGAAAKLKPSAAERDDAWAWYQENIVIANADKA